jgi:hypothetical protein
MFLPLWRALKAPRILDLTQQSPFHSLKMDNWDVAVTSPGALK